MGVIYRAPGAGEAAKAVTQFGLGEHMRGLKSKLRQLLVRRSRMGSVRRASAGGVYDLKAGILMLDGLERHIDIGAVRGWVARNGEVR